MRWHREWPCWRGRYPELGDGMLDVCAHDSATRAAATDRRDVEAVPACQRTG